MIFPRKIKCDICGEELTEPKHGSGWKGWGQITGKINEKGQTEFCLCPKHLNQIFTLIEILKKKL